MASMHRKSRLVDTWHAEIISISLSLLSLLAMLLILGFYNGKVLFNWHKVTINTVISIFATISRMCLMFAVSSGFGQLRWNWFSGQSRPLVDFDTLDAASRGAIGSFRLLWTTKSWAIVAIGAWTTIAVVVFDPFVQQLVSYQVKLVYRNDPGATVALAQRWSGGMEYLTQVTVEHEINPTLDFTMQSSILFGLSANASAIVQQVPRECSTGNCKWTEHLSLAICSSCVNLTNRIHTVRNHSAPMTEYWPNENAGLSVVQMTNHILPNGQTIGNLDRWDDPEMGPLELTTKSTARPSETLAFKSKSTLLQAVSILRADFSGNFSQNWTNVPVTASECALYFCINNYHSKTENGTLKEDWTEIPSVRDAASYQILSDTSGTPMPNASTDALYEIGNWFNRTDFQLLVPPEQIMANNISTANISQPAIDGISAYLNGLLKDGKDAFQTYGCTGGGRARVGTASAGSYIPPSMQAFASTDSLNTTFANLAASISASMRGDPSNHLVATGQVGTYETFIQIRWPWISIPCGCIGLGTIFLILTIRQTNNLSLPIWKSSMLGVLTHCLENNGMKSMEQETLTSQIERSARGTAVILGDRLQLKLADDTAISFGLDYRDREMDPLPRIHVRSRSSSLFASQEIQSLTTTELLHHDA